MHQDTFLFSFRWGVHHPGLPVQRWAGNLLRGGPPLLEGTALLQIWGLTLHRCCGTALRQSVNRSARPPSPGGLKGRQSPLGGLIICKLTGCHLRQQGSERGWSEHSGLPGLGNCFFKTSTRPPTPLPPTPSAPLKNKINSKVFLIGGCLMDRVSFARNSGGNGFSKTTSGLKRVEISY